MLKIGHVHSMSMFTAPRLRYTNTSLPSLFPYALSPEPGTFTVSHNPAPSESRKTCGDLMPEPETLNPKPYIPKLQNPQISEPPGLTPKKV